MTTEMHPIHTGLTVLQHRDLLNDAKKGMPLTDIPSGAAQRRARIRDLEGVRIYRGADSIVVSSLNARDHCQHLGWSEMPTPEWLAANPTE